MRIDRKISLAKAERSELLIQGKTTREGVPISCTVRVYNRSSGELINFCHSDSNGNYKLLGIRNGQNYIIAIPDDTGYNLSRHDRIG